MLERRKSEETDRGREAKTPTQVPAPGWKDIFKRAWQQSQDNNTSMIAGGVTYSVLLALFPGLAVLVSIYGLIFEPAQIEKQMAMITGALPDESRKLISDQLHQLVTASNGALSLGVVVGILIALWSASRGMSGLIQALNIAYEQKETRGFVKLNLIAFGLTVAMIIGGIIVITLVAAVPVIVQNIGLGAAGKWIVLVLEWPLLIVFVLCGLAVAYRYGPNRREARWRWVSPGAIIAVILWVVASIIFSAYVANFNSYNKTYGSLGAVVILLTWLYLSAFVVMFGAEINAQAERQTRKDTTGGPTKPMGERGAWAADTVGEKT